MLKAAEILKTNHTAQLKWLDNQIKKGNDSIFLNAKLAMTAYKRLQNKSMGIIDDKDVEKLIGERLTDDAKKKLITTLRVAKTRAEKKGFQLQVNITYSNNEKLKILMDETGMKKQDVINKLIELADLEKITKTEEQLEITL